ncbi:MAG: DNA replication and repair protein RecF, partial [Pseudomonadota bacterium]
ALEDQLSVAGASVVRARHETLTALREAITTRTAHAPRSPFAWATLELRGEIDDWWREGDGNPDALVDRLRSHFTSTRRRDIAAGRTLVGPHRSDLQVEHGPKSMPAAQCSTGEQKALLVNLVLAHAALVKSKRNGAAPILLLDEIAAHFDQTRRAALFGDLETLGTQAWMTGTDPHAFAPLATRAQFIRVIDGTAVHVDFAEVSAQAE